jgi:ornithine carbamoyltransferase
MTMLAKTRHFLDIDRFSRDELRALLDRAHEMKSATKSGQAGAPLAGKVLAMIFEKPSTRTRFSFEVGMVQLGGHAINVTADMMQLGRGETVADTARVLSRYVDAVMIRTFDEEVLFEFAKHGSVPVINGLTDQSHPCQIMADIMTVEEHRGSIEKQVVAWVGDANNVCRSWMHAAARFGFELRVAAPATLQLTDRDLEWARTEGGHIWQGEAPHAAVEGADVVVTDCFVSMGQKDQPSRHNLLRPYQVDERLMARAKPNAIFMHCLPAHRGEEVSAAVIDGPRSVVFDEAENRLHAQKAILALCMGA